MAKKAELLEQAQKLGLEVTIKNTIAEIQAAIDSAPKAEVAEVTEVVEASENADGKVEVDETVIVEETEDETFAKAGKRSKKAAEEAEAQAEKEARKDSDGESESSKPKYVQKTRSKLERASKKYREAAEKVDNDKLYSLKEGLDIATQTATTKFDSTVELHVRLSVDPKQADQNIREIVVLPEGTGKDVRVAVFGEADDLAAAKAAGADVVGGDEFLQQLDKENFDFDVLVATPTVMAKLGKYARVLGPKGLMPSPKSGTVTTDVASAVKQAKAGKVELRVDEGGIVHIGAGKVSFGADKLLSNANAVFTAIRNAKPGSVKSNFVRSIYLTTTMGPSIKISPSEL